MHALIATIDARIRAEAPELAPLWRTIEEEARFGYDWLTADRATLAPGARILEIGGGTCLLSCLLAADGYAVTTIEPTGDGFAAFAQLRTLVLDTAKQNAITPTIVTCKAEEFTTTEPFDFAFSINVMEHVDDVKTVLTRVLAALKPGASYHFFCPNYHFPYEPHFNIPTLFTKTLTAKIFARAIANHPMPDPAGAWRSLNWITTTSLRRDAAQLPATLTFTRDITARMFTRAVADPEFAARRSPWLMAPVKLATACQLHRLTAYLPVACQPIMDVRISTNASRQQP